MFSIFFILYTDFEASRTLKKTVETKPTSTLSLVITDISNLGNCLSKISTLWATLSIKGIINERPDSSVLVYLPNLSTMNTLDCGTTLIPFTRITIANTRISMVEIEVRDIRFSILFILSE